jgi:hypothetical protein
VGKPKINPISPRQLNRAFTSAKHMAEFDLDIRHRTFVLQASRAEMAARWGGPEQARDTILGHWSVCRQVSDQPELVDIDAMRAAPFD